jgi:hypothetical protein
VVAGDGLQWIGNIAVNSRVQASLLRSSSLQLGVALTIFSERQGLCYPLHTMKVYGGEA